MVKKQERKSCREKGRLQETMLKNLPSAERDDQEQSLLGGSEKKRKARRNRLTQVKRRKPSYEPTRAASLSDQGTNGRRNLNRRKRESSGKGDRDQKRTHPFARRDSQARHKREPGAKSS